MNKRGARFLFQINEISRNRVRNALRCYTRDRNLVSQKRKFHPNGFHITGKRLYYWSQTYRRNDANWVKKGSEAGIFFERHKRGLCELYWCDEVQSTEGNNWQDMKSITSSSFERNRREGERLSTDEYSSKCDLMNAFGSSLILHSHPLQQSFFLLSWKLFFLSRTSTTPLHNHQDDDDVETPITKK